MNNLFGLRYFGGKSITNNRGTPKWIHSLLPDETDVIYIEPFAGMLGILLARPLSRTEIVNDLNGRIVNWWNVIRDQPEELDRLLQATPSWSEDIYWKEIENLDIEDPVRRAYAFTIYLSLSFIPAGKRTPISFPRASQKTAGIPAVWFNGSHIYKLAERMRHVNIYNRDALWIVEKYLEEPTALYYLDPPYYTAKEHTTYSHHEFDRDRFKNLLRNINGRAAISGYNDEYDDLGWKRHEFETYTGMYQGNVSDRIEVLWTNYEPPTRGHVDLFEEEGPF